ncbi:MAG TPA: FtsX-like permease family protein [Phycisphaerae bacterium]|nr:FtsX-like permease family protein [Phycisphaerae bacterium]
MYKLFLCLRYLRSRVIAVVAILTVALCVAMMVIVVSVMNGFLNKIELAAKGLFGDIVIEAPSHQGITSYDKLIETIRNDVPDVQAASPFILSYGVLQIPYQTHIRVWVQVAGIRLPGRAAVSDFEKGLFIQKGFAEPSFDPNMALMLRRISEEAAKSNEIFRRESSALSAKTDPDRRLEAEELLGRLQTAMHYQTEGEDNLRAAADNARELERLVAQLDKAHESGAGDEVIARLQRQIEDVQSRTYEPPENRVILGLGIPGLSIRTEAGETVRYIVPGSKVVLNVIPLGRGISPTGVTPNTRKFSVVDDCRTDVWSIDSEIVYVPFKTLQVLNNMDQPDRCSQIHIKVKDGLADERHLREVSRKVHAAWLRFRKADANAPENLSIQTWRERQKAVIAPLESQRTLVAIIVGILSLVSIAVILLIFHMIVFQKTREIGVLKAVGASSGGVATIFLSYAAAVGLIGAAIGVVGGWYFVHQINPIHDWCAHRLGLEVWSRKVYMFEMIPNTVSPLDAAVIAIGAVVAAVIGAGYPAWQASRLQPVEALRYE